MDECCDVLRMFGAVFYHNVEQCDAIPQTLEAGVSRGMRYEQLMIKMDDHMYMDDSLNNAEFPEPQFDSDEDWGDYI